MKLIGLDQHLSMYSYNTRRVYKSDIEEFFNLCDCEPSEVTKLNGIEYLNYLKQNKLSTTSIARKFCSIRSYFDFLVSIDHIDKNHLKGIKLPRIKHKEKQWLTDEDVKTILSSIPNNTSGKRDRAMIFLMLYNGLRRSEVIGLNIESILPSDVGPVIRIEGKGDKIRTRPLHPECVSAIKSYLKETGRLSEKSGPLFLGKKGRVSSDLIYKVVKKYSKKLKKHVHPHMFRAKFASMALEAGVEITSVQEDMGHVSVETTAMYDASKKSYERSSVHRIRKI